MSVSRRSLTATFLVVAVVLAAGCSGCAHPWKATGTPSTSPESETVVTDMGLDADLEWSPAEALSAADGDTIATVLTARGRHMPFPSRAPVADPDSVTAHFWAFRTIPTNETNEELVVYTADSDILLNLSSPGYRDPAAHWQETAVRGQQAWVSEDSIAGWDLYWVEKGQSYLAVFHQLTVDQAIAWLATWYVLPPKDVTGAVFWTAS